MSRAAELQLCATDIPFVRDRSYTAFLPTASNGGKEARIQDEWDVLALLVQRYEGTSDQRVVRYGGADFVRVRVYEDFTRSNVPVTRHLIPIPTYVVGRLLDMGYVEGTPRFGLVDQTELSVTEQGIHALLGHTQILER